MITGEHLVADHRDLQATSMAIDTYGRHAVLAGRKSLAIIDLDRPQNIMKKVPRQSKWEVSTVEWSPTTNHADMFALCCNQRAELLRWKEGGDISSESMLRAHSRVISDLNWSPLDVNLLATCSVDTYINIWDVRDTRKPCSSFSVVAGASQVKWNKIQPSMLATAHEGDIRLWDHRKSNAPVQYIAAHLSKIHGLDWSPIDEDSLATSSQDSTVKFWDVTSPRRVQRTLSSRYPVWRARYTPFGEGLVTAVVPQLRRVENNLYLWNINNVATPVHSFIGHTDVILEFQWRRIKCDDMQYQLVTWSKDQSLRIWAINQRILKACGHNFETDPLFHDIEPNSGITTDNVDITDTNSPTSAGTASPKDTETATSPTPIASPIFRSNFASTRNINKQQAADDIHCSRSSTDNSSPVTIQPISLQQEFSLVNINIPNVSIEEMNAIKRKCCVKVICGSEVICLQITFPSFYPNNVMPLFKFLPGTSMNSETQASIHKVLQATSEQHIKHCKPCLEPCLRQLVVAIKSHAKVEVEPDLQDTSYRIEPVKHSVASLNMYGCYQDVNVPFPRTCGARFSGPGLLVCFHRPPHLQNINAPSEITPRSLSALAAYYVNHMSSMKAARASASAPVVVQHSQYNVMYSSASIARSPKNDPTEMTISSFYSKNNKVKPNRKHTKQTSPERQKQTKAGPVVVYDFVSLLPISITIAKQYIFDDQDVPAMCAKNAIVAANNGRKDLAQVWSIAAVCANPLLNSSSNADDGVPWAQLPFGRHLLQSLIDHYVKIHDVQTAAMLCCAFTSRSENGSRKKSRSESMSYSPGGSPYHTIHASDTNMDGWNVVNANLKSNRSNSWSDSLDEFNQELRMTSKCCHTLMDIERDEREESSKLLDPKLTWQYDGFKKMYASLLHRWNLLMPKAQVLKYVSTPPPKHKGLEFLTKCQNCQNDVRGPQCLCCKSYSFRCSICRVAVKGLSSFCLMCGHGGHTLHMMEWFKTMEICPTGCGCNCLEQFDIFG